ncbi:hypothetical protein Tco_0494699 [Tanacetum coccineum]
MKNRRKMKQQGINITLWYFTYGRIKSWKISIKIGIEKSKNIKDKGSTASPYKGLSLSDPTNPEEDDSEIPSLEEIYQNSTNGIFTTSSYDDGGAVDASQTWKLL